MVTPSGGPPLLLSPSPLSMPSSTTEPEPEPESVVAAARLNPLIGIPYIEILSSFTVEVVVLPGESRKVRT